MPSYLERRPRAFLHGIWETLQTGGWIRLAKGALIRQLTLTVCALAGILPSAKHKSRQILRVFMDSNAPRWNGPGAWFL